MSEDNPNERGVPVADSEFPAQLKQRVLGRVLRLYRHSDGLSYGRDARRNRADLVLMVGGGDWNIAFRHRVGEGTHDDPETAARVLDKHLRRHRP